MKIQYSVLLAALSAVALAQDSNSNADAGSAAGSATNPVSLIVGSGG